MAVDPTFFNKVLAFLFLVSRDWWKLSTHREVILISRAVGEDVAEGGEEGEEGEEAPAERPKTRCLNLPLILFE